jgi:hypothetical protein
MQHFKHAILQQNISILIQQFGSGFFMKGTACLLTSPNTCQGSGLRTHPMRLLHHTHFVLALVLLGVFIHVIHRPVKMVS